VGALLVLALLAAAIAGAQGGPVASDYIEGAWSGPWTLTFPASSSGARGTITFTQLSDADGRTAAAQNVGASSLIANGVCPADNAQTEFYAGTYTINSSTGTQLDHGTTISCTSGRNLVGRYLNSFSHGGPITLARDGISHGSYTGTNQGGDSGVPAQPISGDFTGPPRQPPPLTTRDEVAPPPTTSSTTTTTPTTTTPGEGPTLDDFLKNPELGCGTGSPQKAVASQALVVLPCPTKPRSFRPNYGVTVSYDAPTEGGSSVYPLPLISPLTQELEVREAIGAKSRSGELDPDDAIAVLAPTDANSRKGVRLCYMLYLDLNAPRQGTFPFADCVKVVRDILNRADALRNRRQVGSTAAATCHLKLLRLKGGRGSAPLKVSCARTKFGMKITIKARSKKRGALKKALGSKPKIVIGRLKPVGRPAHTDDHVNFRWTKR
jgi:hypothetical protein